MIRRTLLILLLALLLAGCPGQWVKVDHERQLSTDFYSVMLPSQWIKVQLQQKWLVTRDGPGLQKILLQAAKHDDAFPTVEMKSAPELLGSELAERFIAEIRKEDPDGLPSFTVQSNQPFSVGDREGFRITASYRTEQGVNYHLVAIGVVSDKGFVSITYTAPAIYYFDRDQPRYEQVVKSLKLL